MNPPDFFDSMERLAKRACGTANGYAFADTPQGALRVHFTSGNAKGGRAGCAYYLNHIRLDRAEIERRAADWAPSWVSLDFIVHGDDRRAA